MVSNIVAIVLSSLLVLCVLLIIHMYNRLNANETRRAEKFVEQGTDPLTAKQWEQIQKAAEAAEEAEAGAEAAAAAGLGSRKI